MKLSSSSTSSSDASVAPDLRSVARISVYTLLWIVALDVLINFATRMPDDPRVPPSRAQSYFDYGRSVEGKLRRMVRATREESAPLSHSGWFDIRDARTVQSRPSGGATIRVTAYGQSFTHRMLQALSDLDPRFELRLLGGPGAPLSHSYAFYQADPERHDADVVVIGVLASTLPGLATLTGMTVSFEAPAPMTYPRFVLRDGKLTAIDPSVRSFEDLQGALRDPVRWRTFQRDLEQHDSGYNPLVFEQDLLDLSSLGRTVRRGVGQKHTRDFKSGFHDADGFINREGVLDVANAILADFAADVRRSGRVPFVVLFNDQGYSDYLVRALGPGLERGGVPYFSTHRDAPATQANLFLKDGHFRLDVDRLFAQEVRRMLVAEVARPH